MINEQAFRDLIIGFEAQGYNFDNFFHSNTDSTIVIRHDIDFSLEAAAKMADIEAGIGISATYFFMTSSNNYNLYSSHGSSLVRKIASLGHTISLHFDPRIYSDLDVGFATEINAFRQAFDVDAKIVSLHRPREFLDDNNRPLSGARHTYEDQFFKEMTYMSDSGGTFKFGHPLENDCIAKKSNIHLLLHPIWWVTLGANPSEKIRNWQSSYFDFINREAQDNCKSFDGHRAT